MDDVIVTVLAVFKPMQSANKKACIGCARHINIANFHCRRLVKHVTCICAIRQRQVRNNCYAVGCIKGGTHILSVAKIPI